MSAAKKKADLSEIFAQPQTPPVSPAADGAAPAAPPAAEPEQSPADEAPSPRPRRRTSTPGDEVEVIQRRVRRPEPTSALYAQVPWSLHEGLKLLAAREGTTLKDELVEAIRHHFNRKKFTPPEY